MDSGVPTILLAIAPNATNLRRCIQSSQEAIAYEAIDVLFLHCAIFDVHLIEFADGIGCPSFAARCYWRTTKGLWCGTSNGLDYLIIVARISQVKRYGEIFVAHFFDVVGFARIPAARNEGILGESHYSRWQNNV